MSRTQAALNDAIDCFRKHDYETAADLFRQAMAGYNDLTPIQQDDLNRFRQANDHALEQRREAGNLLRSAETAQRQGLSQLAMEQVQRALANSYMAPVDRARAQALADHLSNRQPLLPGGDPDLLARAKVQQARQLLTQGNFDAAEQLAREAERLNLKFRSGEDTPRKVIEDITRARSDPKALLAAARSALQHNELDRAETLARAADKAEATWTVHIWGDSPAKVLKDVQAARARPNPSPDKPADKGSAPVPDSVKGLFANKKPDTGNLRADAASPTGPDRKDNPLAADVTLRTGTEPRDMLPQPDSMVPPAGTDSRTTRPATEAPRLPPPPDPVKAKRDLDNACQLLQQGRSALANGQFDQARSLARKADALHADLTFWDDNPAKLLAAVDKAEAARNGNRRGDNAAVPREDPKDLLQKGREAYKADKLEEALLLAQKAKLAPTAKWGLFDFDTPDKLIADINKARTAPRSGSGRPATRPGAAAPGEGRSRGRHPGGTHRPKTPRSLQPLGPGRQTG